MKVNWCWKRWLLMVIENTVLVQGNHYAQMRNVYFIPTALALKNSLKKCRFVDIRIADVSVTTTEEQRRTNGWLLNRWPISSTPHNPSKTVEGYPAPKRAVLIRASRKGLVLLPDAA
ncbi:DUF1698 domain-containing protein [Escherichia coli]